MNALDRILAVGVAGCWAGSLVLAKQGFSEVPPLLMSTLRFGLVALLMVPLTRVSRRQLAWCLLVSLTFGTLHFGLLFITLSLAEVGTSAVLVQLGAPMSSLLACLIFREPLTSLRVAGLACSVIGVSVLAIGPSFPGPLPLVLILASSAAWAVNNLIVKRMPSTAPMSLIGWSSLLCAPQFLVLSLLLEGNPLPVLVAAGASGWISVLYAAIVSSIIAYAGWYWLLARNSINAVVPYSTLNPVIAIGLAALMFGEVITPLKIVGTALILAGVLLVVRQRPAFSQASNG